MKPRLVIALTIAACGAAGCGQAPAHRRLARPPKPVQTVDKVTILTLPAAVNLDDEPGPDGIRIKAMLFQKSNPRPVTVAGQLDFLLYDRKVSIGELYTERPFHVWSFPAEKLSPYLTRNIVGWGYAMELRWGKHGPKGAVISVAARYTPPDGPAVYSSPVVLSISGARGL